MKVNDFIDPFAEDQAFIVDGDYFTDEELCLLYGDYDVLKAKSYADGLWLKLDTPSCDCYRRKRELRVTQSEFRNVKYYDETPICLAAPDSRPCNCGGYRSKCDLHKGEINDKDN